MESGWEKRSIRVRFSKEESVCVKTSGAGRSWGEGGMEELEEVHSKRRACERKVKRHKQTGRTGEGRCDVP